MSQKFVSMGSLAYFRVSRQLLAKEILTLAMLIMQFEVDKKGKVLASMEVKYSFLVQINSK